MSNSLSCQTEEVVRISGYTEGLISSSEVQSSSSQNGLCPWIIETESGRHINISISRSDSEPNVFEPCKEIAVIVDDEVEHTVCGNGKKDEHVYLSQSNEITISFKDASFDSTYMILFQGMRFRTISVFLFTGTSTAYIV